MDLNAALTAVQQYFDSPRFEGITRLYTARQVVEQIRGHFGESVYQTMIPRNVTLAEAPSYGRPALLYNMASAGAQAYLSLAKEFVVHGEKSPR